MAFNFANKHIINKVRNILSDTTDSKYGIEEKVDIVNGALNTYGKYIFNYKHTVLTVNNDKISYTLPTDLINITWAQFEISNNKLVPESDYLEYDGKLVLKSYGTYGSQLNYSSNLEMMYDAVTPNLEVVNIGNLIIGSNTITLDGTKFDLNEYVIIKDATNEEVVKITALSDTSITFTSSKVFTAAYIIGNAKIIESNYDILSSYSNYYDKMKTVGQADSVQWEQGGRSQTISYGASGQITSGNSFDKTLSGFIDMLKTDKNYKFKEFKGFQTIGFYK